MALLNTAIAAIWVGVQLEADLLVKVRAGFVASVTSRTYTHAVRLIGA
jgi:hypothetical protein